MKETIQVFDYAGQITKALPRGILLNTQGEKFNSMVIGWGHLGVIWGQPSFTVYVRQSRFTKPLLDAAREFTLSVPLGEGAALSPEVFRVFGSRSGRDVDKADYVSLEPARSIRTHGIREYPLTLECRVLYQQDQLHSAMSQAVLDRYYAGGGDPGDFHTAYIGQIVDAYVIR